jgi:DNA-directed RNA polymerase subunit M/transcription elongation factor TFIIS
MAETIKCPGCQAVLRVRGDMAGKQIKCPRCAHAVDVPAAEAVTKKAPPPAEEAVEVEPLEDEGVVVRRRSKYEPCPRCGAEESQRVKFTFWGSYYFTALFKHVRCPACGYAYNGRTGRSNLLPAIVCVTVAFSGLLGLLGFIAWFFHRQGYF